MQQLVRDWLEPLTTLLREAAWSMPLGQGMHLLGVSLLIGAAVMLYPRLVGSYRDERPAPVAARLLPWIWIALGLLAATGFVLFSAEPARMMRSPVFRTKMAMLALVIVLTLVLQRRIRSASEKLQTGNALAVMAGVSLTLWLAIAASGRLIGYGRRLLDYFFG
jgi:hypothetical protein